MRSTSALPHCSIFFTYIYTSIRCYNVSGTEFKSFLYNRWVPEVEKEQCDRRNGLQINLLVGYQQNRKKFRTVSSRKPNYNFSLVGIVVGLPRVKLTTSIPQCAASSRLIDAVMNSLLYWCPIHPPGYHLSIWTSSRSQTQNLDFRLVMNS